MMARLNRGVHFSSNCALNRERASQQIEEEKMKKSLLALLVLLLAMSFAAVAQNGNSNSTSESNSNAKSTNSNRKRGPVFRANKDQIKQAQAILKQRGFYSGEQTGKLDPD